MKNRNQFVPIIFSALVFFAGCNSQGSTGQKDGEEENRIISVKATPVQRSKIEYSLSLPGEIHPYEEVQLFAKVKGFVKDLHVDRGSMVQKGQLLATLDAPEITQKFLAAAAKQREIEEQIKYSLLAYQRMKEADQLSGAVAAIELDRTLSQVMRDSASYLALQAEMGAAEQLKNYTSIYAPFDGIVTSRMVSQGALVGESPQPLFTLSQQNSLRLTVGVPEKHAAAIHDQTAISFTVTGRPGENFPATLSRHSRTLDASLRSLIVEFDIDNAEGLFRGGEYAQVYLELSRPQETLQVPLSSVVDSRSNKFVVKVEGDSVHHVPVKTGIRQNQKIEVFGDLEEGDLVAEKGSEELREGTVIEIQQ